ncbi:hypothetical protein B0H10DRAFT_2006793 [Mycena sp. CBHHK59/15]|nr:hypothetical protein B0H10DRAFT_2006793 [Mycena sp. CBHHK59/15]
MAEPVTAAIAGATIAKETIAWYRRQWVGQRLRVGLYNMAQAMQIMREASLTASMRPADQKKILARFDEAIEQYEQLREVRHFPKNIYINNMLAAYAFTRECDQILRSALLSSARGNRDALDKPSGPTEKDLLRYILQEIRRTNFGTASELTQVLNVVRHAVDDGDEAASIDDQVPTSPTTSTTEVNGSVDLSSWGMINRVSSIVSENPWLAE